MYKKLLLCLLPLVGGLLWISTGPSHAAGESWSITDVNASGCAQNEYDVDVHYDGLVPNGTYVWHTRVISGGKVYMNEIFEDSHPTSSGNSTWTFYALLNGQVDNPGTWPLTPGTPVKFVLSLESTQGAVLSSWTAVARSCDSAVLLYNGPTAADVDEDYLATPTDLCPSLKAFTANGCPVVDRTLTLKAKADPRRVVGTLAATGHSSLYAGRPVTIWKVRPGPDRVIATKSTNSLGKVKVRVGRGRYYATTPGLVAPSSGEVLADQSNTTRVR
jgi:hypothetical protein